MVTQIRERPEVPRGGHSDPRPRTPRGAKLGRGPHNGAGLCGAGRGEEGRSHRSGGEGRSTGGGSGGRMRKAGAGPARVTRLVYIFLDD